MEGCLHSSNITPVLLQGSVLGIKYLVLCQWGVGDDLKQPFADELLQNALLSMYIISWWQASGRVSVWGGLYSLQTP